MENNYKIFVETAGKWAEVEVDNFDLSTTFSLEEIKDVSKRKDTITKTIVIKGTKGNNIIFGGLYDISREVSLDESFTGNLLYNYKPNKYLNCFVLENNVEIIKGKLLITSIDIKEGTVLYNCSIIGNTFSFFSNLEGKYLHDLNSLIVDETGTAPQDIINSWRLPLLRGNPNLINKESSTSGGYVNLDGTINTSGSIASNSSYTDFLPIKPSSTYNIRKSDNPQSDKFIRLAIYDSSKNMIDRITTDGVNTDYVFTTSKYAEYIRVSFPTAVNNVKLEEGDEFTEYSDSLEVRPDWFFPLIDYGVEARPSSNLEISTDNFRPAYYTDSYLKAIVRGFRTRSDGTVSQFKTDDGEKARDVNDLLSDYTLEGVYSTRNNSLKALYLIMRRFMVLV